MLTTALKMPHICIYTLCMQICVQADYYTLKWYIDLLALKGSCFPNIWNAINVKKNSLWGSLLVFSRLSCCAAATCPTGFCTQSPRVVTGEWAPSREWRWTGSGGRSPTPGTRAHRRGRTQPGTACCSGWPQSPASGTQADWVTNRNTRWTVTVGGHKRSRVSQNSWWPTFSLGHCAVTSSNNTQPLLSVRAAKSVPLAEQPLHCSLLRGEMLLQRHSSFSAQCSTKESSQATTQHKHRQSKMSLSAVVMAAEGVTRSAVICQWHPRARSCWIKVCRQEDNALRYCISDCERLYLHLESCLIWKGGELRWQQGEFTHGCVLFMRVRLQSKLHRTDSYLSIYFLPSAPAGIILSGNEIDDVSDKIVEVLRLGQQRALSHHAKELQEDEVIEEHDAIWQQRPPHVSHRFRLIDTCNARHAYALKRAQLNQIV